MSLNILGISAYYHDSACCLMTDGRLIAAAQEERFSRIKNDPSFPINALRYCLEQNRMSITDLDAIAYYEDPVLKLSRQLWSGNVTKVAVFNDDRFNPNRPMLDIREKLGYEGPIKFFKHHQSHAASSFYFSGFPEAAIMTVDGVGEWATTTYGYGNDGKIELVKEIEYPHSIGLLYSTITNFLGFEVNEGEYKVMGLAPYGIPKYFNKFQDLIELDKGYDFRLNMKFFNFVGGSKMFSDELCELFGNVNRRKGEAISQFHMDVASSLQKTLERLMVDKAMYLSAQTGLKKLCLSGGVGLNCVSNRAILNEGTIKEIFVPPGCNDSGCAIGAAALASIEIFPDVKMNFSKLTHAYWGPAFSSDEIHRLIESSGFSYSRFCGDTPTMLRKTAEMIQNGKVVGWFQGRMEFGPRALGARSILADPRSPLMRELINSMVKKREGFRPFAPTVTEEDAHLFFNIDHSSPFMLETCPVKDGVILPAVTHVDSSARLQTVNRMSNPLYYDLLKEFEAVTGYPILLNTSFNVNKEPIVCTPVDALRCFIKSNIDALVIEDFIIERSMNTIDELLIKIQSNVSVREGIIDSLYTFI